MGTIVTGASGALGSAVVKALAGRSEEVVAIDRASRSDFPSSARQIVCEDLADEEQAAAAIGSAVAGLKSFDALVLIAGKFDWARVEDAPAEFWRRLYRDNVETTLVPLRAALPSICAGASIVCVGANSAEPAGEGMAAYASSKSAVARLVEALASELKPRRIRVNAILPGIIDTPRNRADMPDADPSQWTSPDAIADVVAFLASSAARAINGALVPTTANG